jgi:uncharacterized membrane protein YcfT
MVLGDKGDKIETALAKPAVQRLQYVDTAKCIGIFLMILGHTVGTAMPIVSRIIYAFHMPLFFLLSGYVAQRFGFVERGGAQGLVLSLICFGLMVPAICFCNRFVPNLAGHSMPERKRLAVGAEGEK